MGRRAAPPRRLTAAGKTAGVTLDAGALIALERPHRRYTALLEGLLSSAVVIVVPAAALAQVWRNSPRQHRLARLLSDDRVVVTAMDLAQALSVGSLLARSGTNDVVDAAVAVTARERSHVVITTDPDDLIRLDPKLLVVAV